MMAQRIGIYPGTFDPITKGHLHIIKRASTLVDRLVIGVAANARKGSMFSFDERVAMVKADVANMPEKFCTVDVVGFDNLLIHFAREIGATCIFRGLRAVSDFDYEFQMTGMNAKLDPGIETVFLMAADRWQFVSSSFVREIFALGGDLTDVITPAVVARMREKLAVGNFTT